MGRLVKIPASMGLSVNARGIFFKIVERWVLGLVSKALISGGYYCIIEASR